MRLLNFVAEIAGVPVSRHLAKGAIEAGHKPEIVLAGDAAVLARKPVTESVLPVGMPPLKDLTAFALEHGVPVYT